MISTSFNITEPLSQVGFSYTTSDLTAYFTNTSTLGAYSWDFGNGFTSSSNSPWHTYTNNGTYTVCLDLITTCGTTTFCNDITVFDSSSIDIS